MTLVGNVHEKNVFITDDMIATGGTLLNACRLLKDKGALDIHISVSLPFFSNKSYELFDKAYSEGLFKRVIGTDAVFWGNDFLTNHPWYQEISMAPLFAKVIHNMNIGKSVSRLLA
jgi:ribose-phosphate pyrophosphokinase